MPFTEISLRPEIYAPLSTPFQNPGGGGLSEWYKRTKDRQRMEILVSKCLFTPRGYGLFLSENHDMEDMLMFLPIFLFKMILENPQSDFQIFTFSEGIDDFSGLFTSQLSAVVALSNASVCQPRTPSSGALLLHVH